MSLLYTIMPLELVLDGMEEERGEEIHELPIQGGTLVVEAAGRNRAKILRLISSDPGLFLRPDLQPGRIIEFPLRLDM